MKVSAERDSRRAGVIWVMNLDWPRPSVEPAIPLTFRQIGPESLPALTQTLGEATSREFMSRLESSRRCYAAWAESGLAGYGWVSFEEEFIGELNLRVHLLPGEAYIWDCVTFPTFRRQGLYSTLLIHIAQDLSAKGFCRAWIGADLDNIPSQRGIARAGFQPVADLVETRVIALRRVWAQGRPGVSEQIVTEARRAFLGDRDKVWLAALSSAMKNESRRI